MAEKLTDKGLVVGLIPEEGEQKKPAEKNEDGAKKNAAKSKNQ